jgi:transposase-like protein
MKEVAMPWKEQTLMSLRVQFVQSLLEGDSSLSQLCRQFGISRKTAYKWIARFREGGWSALADRSKRPIHSPTRTEDSTEDAVLRVRDLHKAWGARKIASFLSNQGFHQLPAPSTITAILRRHGRIDPSQSSKHKPFIRFCMQSPNQLWQMDFKGHFMLGDGQSCHPLTILDSFWHFAPAQTKLVSLLSKSSHVLFAFLAFRNEC